MVAATDLGLHVDLKAACRAFSLNRAFVYRERLRARPTGVHSVVRLRGRPPLAFCAAEQALLLALLNSERFADIAPAAIFAILLDEGRYHGSIRTMYRLLAACHQSGERRRQRVHPVYIKPELLAVRPNQIWSWDITKLNKPSTENPQY
jgi:putative transposase